MKLFHKVFTPYITCQTEPTLTKEHNITGTEKGKHCEYIFQEREVSETRGQHIRAGQEITQERGTGSQGVKDLKRDKTWQGAQYRKSKIWTWLAWWCGHSMNLEWGCRFDFRSSGDTRESGFSPRKFQFYTTCCNCHVLSIKGELYENHLVIHLNLKGHSVNALRMSSNRNSPFARLCPPT